MASSSPKMEGLGYQSETSMGGSLGSSAGASDSSLRPRLSVGRDLLERGGC